MKICIVNFKNNFDVRMKERPCIMIKQSKKHVTVMPITHHPRKNTLNTSFYLNDGRYQGTTNLLKTFTVRWSDVVTVVRTLNVEEEQKLREAMKKYKQKNYVARF